MPPRRRKRNFARRVAVAGAVVLLLGFLFWNGIVRLNYPSRSRYPVRGIDVSHHNGPIDWSRVRAAGIEFAYLKASEGATWRDTTFAANRDAAIRAGLATGAYHYFTLCAPGDAQARNFLAAAPPLPGRAVPPAVDLEYLGNCAARPPRDSVLANVRAFLAPVEAAYGRRVVLYATHPFADTYLRDALPNPLWVRSVFGPPRYGQGWTLWQFADRGRVDGAGGFVDLNVFEGSREAFATWSAGRAP